MQLQFGKHDSTLGNQLKCLTCGCDYLQHHATEIYDTNIRVSVEDSKASIDTDLANKPFQNLDGLKIRLICNVCLHETLFFLVQFNGRTYLNSRIGRNLMGAFYGQPEPEHDSIS